MVYCDIIGQVNVDNIRIGRHRGHNDVFVSIFEFDQKFFAKKENTETESTETFTKQSSKVRLTVHYANN